VARRFRREVRAAAKLAHPNIISVYQTDLNGPVKYLVMEMVTGTNLNHLVQDRGRIPPAEAAHYVREAALGLQHALERGVVHRDIKPDNLIVAPLPAGRKAGFGTVKILDMGLARITEAGDGEGMTLAGDLLGTPDFMAPEQADDPRRADTRSDLYALGTTFYYLLTGRPPFDADNLADKLQQHQSGVTTPIEKLCPELSPGLADVVRRLMAKNPDDRYQTPHDLIEALDAVGRGGPAPSTPTPLPAVTFAGHNGPVQAMAVSPDGKYLLTGGADETVRLWDVAAGRETRRLASDGGPVNCLAIASDGSLALAAQLRLLLKTVPVRVWDIATGKELGKLKGTSGIASLAAAGKRAAAGCDDGTIIVWTLDGQTSAVRMAGHDGPVTALAFQRGASRLLSGGRDGMLRAWKASTGESQGSRRGRVGAILAMASAGTWVAVAGDSLQLRQPDGTFAQLYGHRGPVCAVAFGPAGKHLVSGGADGTVRLWDLVGAREVEAFSPHTGKVTAVAFAPDGRAVFSAGDGGQVRRSGLRTGGA
jgi:hypothetical protein